ncbi:hypothetical protein HKD37_18G050149 [Glycine soja]
MLKKHALRCPYRTCARARVMGKAEEMEADMEAMKEQMAAMMEAMMSVKKIMEANAVAIAATSVVAKVNLMSPSDINQMNHPTSDMVGKDLGSTGGPHDVQIQNEHAFPPYGLPLNYKPPNMAYAPNKNVNNSTPIPIESQQPQTDHAHTHEIPHHNLADFEPWLGYAIEGQAVGGIPLENTSEGPQYHPQLHLLHSTTSGETWQLKWHLNDGEKMIMIVDTLPVFYYEKMVDYTPSSFADMVFTDERIKVSLKKGKFSHPAWTNEKTGANEEGENEGQAHAVTAIPIQPSFPPTQQCHYSANNKPSPYPPPSYPQRLSLNQPQSLPTALPMTNTTFSTNQKHQPRNEFCSEKACRIHPNSEYDSNATCVCHGEAPWHSIEHCRGLKRKVQGLIDAGWLKFEENHV